MKSLDRPGVGLCLDLSAAVAAMEGPEQYLTRLAPWCRNFIIKDAVAVRSDSRPGFSVEGRPAGEGRLPLQWALQQLRRSRIRHSTVIELWTPWQGDIVSTIKVEEEWVARSVEFMRRLI
jgi:sugar phosphate isomerase/epimerase